MWLKAPFLLFRWPPILGSIGVGITVLVISTAVAPLFLSSAAGGALHESVSDLPPSSAGLTVAQGTPLVTLPLHRPGEATRHVTPEQLHRLRSRELDEALSALPHLGDPIQTVGTGESVLSAKDRSTQVQPLARAGFLPHITVEASVDGPGAYLARQAADRLDVEPGDVLGLQIDGPTQVRVKGIYSDLVAEPVTPYWLPVDRFIHAATPKENAPPPPLLMEIPLLLELGRDSDSFGFESWEYPLVSEGMTLDQGRHLSESLLAISRRSLDQDTRLGSLFNEPFLDTTLQEAVDGATETVTGVESPVQVLALIGGLVALVLIAISAHYVVQKRSIEFRLLVARGVGGGWVALRSIVETSVVACVFGALGTGLAVVLVGAFGPGPVDGRATRQAVWLAAASLVVALAAIGIATAVAARKKTAVERSSGSHDTGFPWEIVLLVFAGFAYYLIDRRGAIDSSGGSGGRVDILLVIFPLLGIAGAALFLLRIGFSYLNRARGATERSGIAPFLAARRLASASRSVMLFVGAAAVSVGMLVYSTGLVSSVRATTYAKTHVFVGSDVSVVVSGARELDLAFPHTFVTAIDGEVSDRKVDVLGIEPDSFLDAAYWDDDFADTSLASLVGKLGEEESESLPVLIAGADELDPESFSVAGHTTPIEVVGRARTWPGMTTDTPMIVAAEEALTESASAAGWSTAIGETDLWVRGPTNDVLAALEVERVDTQVSVSARDAARSSALLSISWTFGLLRVLGIAAGLMSIVGMVLYVASRHRARLVSYLLGRRMGLLVGQHRFALLLELLVMLIAALALGGLLGLLAERLVYRSLDLLPTVPPAPLFRVPVTEMIAAGLLFLVASVLGSRLIQRASDRVRAGEVMRLAD